MPRTIWQFPADQQHYIGHQIWRFQSGVESVAPVWDHEVNDWIRLNADADVVDYRVTDVKPDRATLVWDKHYDYVQVRVYLNSRYGERIFYVPGDRTSFLLSGLMPDTEYTVNVYAELSWGDLTQSNRQTFRSGIWLIPPAPGALRYSTRSNSHIQLAWNPALHAVRYEVYRAVGNGHFRRVSTVTSTSISLSLKEDTKYRFAVRGENRDGRVGPMSNIVKSATGHDTVRRRGEVKRLVLPPKAWGSWRPDIKWKWWANRSQNNLAIYQGYWNRAGTRYTGIVEYDSAALRRIIDNRLGKDVSKHLRVTKAALRRVYRQREPGNFQAQETVWHLTNTRVRASLSAPSFFGYYGGRRIKAGQGINLFEIPASWGAAIIRGKRGSSPVRGLALHRNDNQNNGYGFAGYAKISGHNQPDYHLGGGGGRKSDLSLVIDGRWDFVEKSYKAPYDW